MLNTFHDFMIRKTFFFFFFFYFDQIYFQKYERTFRIAIIRFSLRKIKSLKREKKMDRYLLDA